MKTNKQANQTSKPIKKTQPTLKGNKFLLYYSEIKLGRRIFTKSIAGHSLKSHC